MRFFVNVLAEKVELDNFHVNERERNVAETIERRRESKKVTNITKNTCTIDDTLQRERG